MTDNRSSTAVGTMQRRLPDFLGIGALKAGTSYLEDMLRSHPGISMPVSTKGLEYFSRHYERGPDWYAAQFSPANKAVMGEVSPQYLFDPRCPARIAELLPRARLVVSVRDPIARAYSQYKHWMQVTAYKGSFDDYLIEHPGVMERGRYFELLSRYLELFDREQLYVLVFEELVQRPAEVLPEVYAFIGADPSYVPAHAEAPIHSSYSPRFRRAHAGAKRLSRWLRDRGAGRLAAQAKSSVVGRILQTPTADRARFGALPPPTAARLADAYAPDVASLSELLGRDLSVVWPAFPPVA